MRFMKLAFAVAMALACGSAYAFHDGGVASCESCHVMHNASNGAAKTTSASSAYAPRTNTVNSFLLQGSDQSSTCLICHGKVGTSSYIVASLTASGASPAKFTPGGDFGWLTSVATGGARKGHNIQATDLAAQFPADTLTTAPGGTFKTGTGIAGFSCANCHDPHGRYRLVGDPANPTVVGPSTPAALKPIVASGSYGAVTTTGGTAAPSADYAVGVYRILGGKGYAPAGNPGYPFVNDPPAAVAPKTYNTDEATGETRVAYGQGMSEWCQNCHTDIHMDSYTGGTPGLRHPAGNGAKLGAVQVGIYNSYIATGNLTGTNRYSSLVPFEVGTNNITATAGVGLASGAANAVDPAATTADIFVAKTSNNVMCLSCHRAHASGFDSMTRFGTNGIVTTETAYNATGGLVDAQLKAAYYNRSVGTTGTSIAPFQRALCNKCHGKD